MIAARHGPAYSRGGGISFARYWINNLECQAKAWRSHDNSDTRANVLGANLLTSHRIAIRS